MSAAASIANPFDLVKFVSSISINSFVFFKLLKHVFLWIKYQIFSGSRALEGTYAGKYIYSPAMASNLKEALARHEHMMKKDKRLDLEYVKSVSYKNFFWDQN